jgi:DNA-directed RNA polymerase subunit RPC12/RpoP
MKIPIRRFGEQRCIERQVLKSYRDTVRNAKHGSPIKGVSTMGVGLKQLIKKRYTTLLVDEFNTSKKCSRCWKDISRHVKVDGSKKFRLLKCKHCIGSILGAQPLQKT